MPETYEYDRGLAAVWSWGASQWMTRLQRVARFPTWPALGHKWIRLWWWLEWFLLVCECVFLGEMLETVLRVCEPRLRKLTLHERSIATQIFGDSIDLNSVRIDEHSYIVARRLQIAYVRLHTINCWSGMRDTTFVHELVHVWQYQHYGASYIPRALAAQYSKDGYNYGGLNALLSASSILSFNFEQQGDLIEDAWRFQQGKKLLWSHASPEVFEQLDRLSKDVMNPPDISQAFV